MTSEDERNLCAIVQHYSMSKQQHVVRYARDAKRNFSLGKEDLSRIKSDFPEYKIGILHIQKAKTIETSKRTRIEEDSNDTEEQEAITLFQLSRIKNLLDLVLWIETPVDEDNLPKIINVLNTLSLEEQDRHWHRSFGRILGEDLEPNAEELTFRFIHKAAQILSEFDIVLELEKTPASRANYAISINAAIEDHGNQSEIIPTKKLANIFEILVSFNSGPPDSSLDNVNEEIEAILKIFAKDGNSVSLNENSRRLSDELKNKFAWHIACHTGTYGIIVDNDTGLELITEDRIVQLCKENSVVTGTGNLQVVFINGCNSSRTADRLWSECRIPHVISWSTRCADDACKILASKFWTEFLSFSDKNVSLDFKVREAFERTKRHIENDFKFESGKNIQIYPQFVFEDPDDPAICMDENNKKRVPLKDRPLQFAPFPIGKLEHKRNPPNDLRIARVAKIFDKKTRKELGSLRVSPISMLTLSGVSRERALIPNTARSYAFCYPPSLSLMEVLQRGRKLDDFAQDFLDYGGFLYFDKGNIVTLNALSCKRAAGRGILNFSERIPLREDVIDTLRLANRLEKINEELELGWILPREEIAPHFHQFDHGAIVLVGNRPFSSYIYPVAKSY